LCTLIAGRIGPRQDAVTRGHVRHLAVAVELVHAATLLHDDVVDVADTRRGQPTARQLHGNEVSIFAGDWLLVAALRRIVAGGHPELVQTALDTIEQMIFGEVEQVERAKCLADDIDGYYRVIDRKTAALFRWALQAGARASGCPSDVEAALVAYGNALGTAFQVVDDVLDLAGDPQATGKALFGDLAEGKVTLPLALMLRQRPDLRPLLVELREECVAQKDGVQRIEEAKARIVIDAVRATGALQAAREAALRHTEAAKAALQGVPDGAEVAALYAIADALAARRA
jgi:octaprenyl-diphosphate synthase